MKGISYEFNIVSNNGDISEESYREIKEYYASVDRDIRVAEPISVDDVLQLSILDNGVFRAKVVEKVLIISNDERSCYTTRYGVSLQVIGQKDDDVIYGNWLSNDEGLSNK